MKPSFLGRFQHKAPLQWGFFATSPAIIIPKLPKIIPNKFPLKRPSETPIFWVSDGLIYCALSQGHF
nr:MAG TPA: hypothetical protein [Inoviridae sp.]